MIPESQSSHFLMTNYSICGLSVYPFGEDRLEDHVFDPWRKEALADLGEVPNIFTTPPLHQQPP